MRAVGVVAVLVLLAVASAVDVDSLSAKKLREKRAAIQKLAELQARFEMGQKCDFPRFQTAEQLGLWDEYGCKICMKTIGALSNALVNNIIGAPADATANGICLPAEALVLPACIAIVPGGSALCPAAMIYVHGKCTDLVNEQLKVAEAKRKLKKLIADDFPALKAENLCKSLHMC